MAKTKYLCTNCGWIGEESEMPEEKACPKCPHRVVEIKGRKKGKRRE